MERQLNKNLIKLIIYDFDGVMTDNRLLVDENGKESVFVNRGDGYAISKIKKLGIKQIIVSTEINRVVSRRAEKLGIDVIHGVSDKEKVVCKYCEAHGINTENVLFVGNDLNDLPAMGIVRYKAAPRDAEEEILAVADWISEKGGGEGVIRDLYRCLTQEGE